MVVKTNSKVGVSNEPMFRMQWRILDSNCMEHSRAGKPVSVNYICSTARNELNNFLNCSASGTGNIRSFLATTRLSEQTLKNVLYLVFAACQWTINFFPLLKHSSLRARSGYSTGSGLRHTHLYSMKMPLQKLASF